MSKTHVLEDGSRTLLLRGLAKGLANQGVSRGMGSRESCSYAVPTGSLRKEGSRKGSRKGLANEGVSRKL